MHLSDLKNKVRWLKHLAFHKRTFSLLQFLKYVVGIVVLTLSRLLTLLSRATYFVGLINSSGSS